MPQHAVMGHGVLALQVPVGRSRVARRELFVLNSEDGAKLGCK